MSKQTYSIGELVIVAWSPTLSLHAVVTGYGRVSGFYEVMIDITQSDELRVYSIFAPKGWYERDIHPTNMRPFAHGDMAREVAK